jgi:hypothetical protein
VLGGVGHIPAGRGSGRGATIRASTTTRASRMATIPIRTRLRGGGHGLRRGYLAKVVTFPTSKASLLKIGIGLVLIGNGQVQASGHRLVLRSRRGDERFVADPADDRWWALCHRSRCVPRGRQARALAVMRSTLCWQRVRALPMRRANNGARSSQTASIHQSTGSLPSGRDAEFSRSGQRLPSGQPRMW